MSSQPSQLDIAKDKASGAYETVINKVQDTKDPKAAGPELTKDANGQTIKKGDFRDQLNEASKPQPQKEEAESFVDKGVFT